MLIPAQASNQHARHFVQLAQIASDNLLSELFGPRAHAVFEASFMLEHNEYSHRHTRFLLVQGEIAGMVQGCRKQTAEAYAGRALLLMLLQARWQVFRFFFSAWALRDILHFMSRCDSEDFYINFVALYPQFRGRGYSKSLLAEAERMALEQHCRRLALDVDERNAAARGAYRSAGFEQISASKKMAQSPEPWAVLRLAKPLTKSA